MYEFWFVTAGKAALSNAEYVDSRTLRGEEREVTLIRTAAGSAAMCLPS